jgi:hypothetical protein
MAPSGEQLDFIAREVKEIREKMQASRGVGALPLAARLHMLLSLAESVKQARYHNLNCRNLEKKR